MNNLLNNPLGVDAIVQDIQIDLYSALSYKWQGEIEGYGKIYRNPINKGIDQPEAYATSKIITPEWFNATTQDYESVYYNDNKSCVFCFLLNDTDSSDDEFVFINRAKVIFMSDLDKVYPSVAQRQDSKQEVEAIRILRKISHRKFKVIGIERRIENIFREFSSKEVRFDNMNKRNLFAINIELNYHINDCN